jgi:N-acyl-D-aspartate/D-glutamate deacylase
LEIEKVAGYCHERRKLRTIWLHRIRSVVDAATGEQIHDLAAWLERAPEAAPAAMSAAAATDEATLHAWRQGETEIAERLFRIGAQLKRQDPSNRPC